MLEKKNIFHEEIMNINNNIFKKFKQEKNNIFSSSLRISKLQTTSTIK